MRSKLWLNTKSKLLKTLLLLLEKKADWGEAY